MLKLLPTNDIVSGHRGEKKRMHAFKARQMLHKRPDYRDDELSSETKTPPGQVPTSGTLVDLLKAVPLRPGQRVVARFNQFSDKYQGPLQPSCWDVEYEVYDDLSEAVSQLPAALNNPPAYDAASRSVCLEGTQLRGESEQPAVIYPVDWREYRTHIELNPDLYQCSSTLDSAQRGRCASPEPEPERE